MNAGRGAEKHNLTCTNCMKELCTVLRCEL